MNGFEEGLPIPFILNIVEGWAEWGGRRGRPPCLNPPYRKSGKIRLSMLLS